LAQTYAITDLGTLAGNSSAATGINTSGQVTGPSTLAGDSIVHAFMYGGGVMTDIGTLSGYDGSYGTAINASGQVTGYVYFSKLGIPDHPPRYNKPPPPRPPISGLFCGPALLR
jgi:probable HAF family extracellular repeat protein